MSKLRYTVPASLLHPQIGVDLPGRQNHRKSGRRNHRFPNLNISKLAGKIGVHPSYLGRILNGTIQPGLPYAIRLSKALKISIEEVEKLYGSSDSNKS